jgi:hypothetical protein
MNDSQTTSLEKMNKRRELMEDGRRYIIFYTFGLEDLNSPPHDTETQKENEEKPD